MSTETSENGSIIVNQMKDSIRRSGYLLEQRIESILIQQGYYVQTNPVFPDPETGKTREIDVSALSATRVYSKLRKTLDFIFPVILCECENNAQPLVFFTKESPISFMYHENVKVSGLPVKFWQEEEDLWEGFSEFTGMEKFHHYCKGPIATQWCTFHLPKRQGASWIAWHTEEQHDSFNSLVKALDYKIAQHYDNWYLPESSDKEAVNVQIYYPILILQSKLYSATLKDGRLILRKSRHIQFMKKLFLPRSADAETYQIDIITEDYLPTYIKIVDSEINSVKRVFQRRRAEVLLSIGKIVGEAKKLGRKPKSYREYFEF